MKKNQYVAPKCVVIEVQAMAVFAGSEVRVSDPWEDDPEEEW